MMMGRVIQPRHLFEMLDIKNSDEAERVLTTVLYLLIYLKPGDVLKTNVAEFVKLAPDLIQMDSNIDSDIIVDELEKKKIISLPL